MNPPEFFRDPPISRQCLERILHPIIPRDLSLYWAALTHASVRSMLGEYPVVAVHSFYLNGHFVYGNDYEKLEFLGDSIIHASLASILIRMYPDKNEGFLSRVRINIERKSGLAQLCREIGLAEYVKKHPDMPLTDAILENVYEGFVGALFEDQQKYLYNGLQRASEFLLRTLHSRFHNIHDIRIDDNFKDTVLRLFDRKVFERVDMEYVQQRSGHERQDTARAPKVHMITLTCKYVPTRVQYISTHGYGNPDLAAVMQSIPATHVETKVIRQKGRNKREAEQRACEELMETFGIRMARLA